MGTAPTCSQCVLGFKVEALSHSLSLSLSLSPSLYTYIYIYIYIDSYNILTF